MHPRVKLWLIAIAFSAAACGLFAALSPAHSAEACTSVEVIKKQALDSGVGADNVYTLLGAKQANLYASALGLIFPDDSQPTGWLFIELPAIGAIMRGA